MLLEDLEGVGQKTNLMPHAGALHGNQRNPLLDRNGFDLRGGVGDVGAHHRALQARRLRGIHMQWNLVLPHGQHAARMQHLGAVACDLLRLIVVQLAQQSRSRHRARIGAEQTRHIGPNLETGGTELGCEIGSRRIRAAAPQQHRVSSRIGGDETLSDHYLIE